MKVELNDEQKKILEDCKKHITDPTGAIKMCMNDFIEKSHPSTMERLPVCLARMKDFIELAEKGTAQQVAWRTTELAIDLLKLAQEYNNEKGQIENAGMLKGAQTIIGMCGFN